MSKVFLFPIIFIIGCNSKAEFSSTCAIKPSKLLTEVIDEENGFSIEIPERFSVVEPFAYFELVAIDSTEYSQQRVTTITVETYDLNEGQSFQEFYQDIDDRTLAETKPDSIEFTFDFTDKYAVNAKESKISTVSMSQYGITLVTRTFYIKQDETILTVSVATTKPDAENEFCELSKSVESIRKI